MLTYDQVTMVEGIYLAISRYHNLQPTVCNVVTQNEPNIFYLITIEQKGVT